LPDTRHEPLPREPAIGAGWQSAPLQPVLNPLKIYEMNLRTAKYSKEKLYFLAK